MKIKFENGNEINSIHIGNKNICGNRSKIVGCNGYDIETDTWVFCELNMSKPINRYIPEWMYTEWLINKGELK